MAEPATTASDLRPYPSYRPSGVKWLGEVPAHWQMRRLKTLCSKSAIYGANVAATSYAAAGVRFIRTTDITEDGILRPTGVFLPREAVRDYILTDGDLLISRSGTIGRSFLYRAAVHGPCAYAGYLVRFVLASGVSPEYTFLFTKTPAFGAFLQSKTVSSTIENVNASKYANCPLPVPPLAEQVAIARYLNQADRRIQRCIQAKEKLVKLLEEQRQTLVSEAVTGRVDVRTGQPYPAYKDAGVDWLGSVPSHWNVHRARYVFRDIDERSVAGKEQHLSMSQRLGLVPSRLVENRTLISESYAGGKLCRSGDLVLNRLKAHLGVFALAKQSGVTSPDYTVLRPNTDVWPQYLEYVLRSPSCRGELRTRAKGIVEGFWRLYTDDFFEIRLPLPPRHEQSSIIAWIGSLHSRSDRIVAHAHHEIDLLREYRTRLIADVVGGKLDVREAAAEVTDDVEEPESTAGSSVETDIDQGPDREVSAAAQETDP